MYKGQSLRVFERADNWKRMLLGSKVLVGIPDGSANKKSGQQLALIGYSMEHGTSRGVPSRPFLRPGLERARPQIIKLMAKATSLVMDGKSPAAILEKIGMTAVNNVKMFITEDPHPPPLSPKTIRARKYQRMTKSRRKSEKLYHAMTKEADAQIQESLGIKTLVNTGQMRTSVTYYVDCP